MRRVLMILLVLVLIVVGGGLGAFYLTPSGTLASIAAERVREATGRELSIGGVSERRLYPTLGLTLTDVAISDADWAGSEPMISADVARVGVQLTSLFGGGPRIEDVTLTRPVVRLRREASGRANWDDLAAAPQGAGGGAGGGSEGAAAPTAPATGADPVEFAVASARIEDGVLVFIDETNDRRIEVAALNVSLSAPAADRALSIEGSGVVNGRDARVTAAITSPAALAAGQPVAVDAVVNGDGLSMSFDATTAGYEEPMGPAFETTGSLIVALDGDRERTAWLREALGAQFSEVGAFSAEGDFEISAPALVVDLRGDAEFRGAPANFAVQAQAGEGWIDGTAQADVDVSLTGGGADIGYVGSVQAPQSASEPPRLDGRWRLSAADAQAVLALAGATPVAGDPLARLQSIDLSGEADVAGETVRTTVSGSAGYGDRTVSLDGFLALSGGLPGGAVEADLTAASDAFFSARWTGSATTDDAGGLSGLAAELAFESAALRDFLAWANVEGLPDEPRDSFQTVAFTADAGVDANLFRLSEIELAIDEDRVSGEISVFTADGRPPRVVARLQTTELDLRPFTALREPGAATPAGGASGSGPSAPPPPPQGWSEAPLDFSALSLINADISVRTEGLITEILRLEASQVDLALSDGDLSTRLALGLYGGTARGDITLGAAQKSATADLVVSGVALRPLLSDLAQIDYLEGTGAFNVDIRGQGESMRAMMGSLEGDASIDLADGALVGFNLAALVRNVTSLGAASEGVQRTDFSSMTGTFALSQGVARTEDFEMLGPLVRLTARGDIDIGAQTLDLRAVPRAVATLRGQGGDRALRGVAFPLLITGTWANPRFQADLQAGALDAVEGLLTDPTGAAAFLEDLGGDSAAEVIEGVLGDDGSVVDDAIEGVLDGALGDGEASEAVRGVLDGVLGGDGEGESEGVGDALRGLFGN